MIMFSLNSDDEKNKKKKSDGLNYSIDGDGSLSFGDVGDSFMGMGVLDNVPAKQKLYSEPYEKNRFFDIAAKERNEIPADIAKLINDNPGDIGAIRKIVNALLVSRTIKLN